MKKILLVTAMMVAGLGVAQADDGFIIEGAGAMTCTQYLSAIRTAGKVVDADFLSWAQGFMSAANAARMNAGHNSKNLSSISVEDQARILRQYCVDNPAKEYVDGIMTLFSKFEDNDDAGTQ